MTEKEHQVQMCICSLANAEISVRKSKTNLELTKLDLEAGMKKQLAELTWEIDRAEIDVRRAQASLLLAKADLERGFAG